MEHIDQNSPFTITSQQKTSKHHFEGVNFADLKKEGIVFEDCIFENVNFASSQFKELEVYNCQFLGCRFTHAQFNEALLDSCIFYDGKKDQGTDFSYAQLKFSKFLSCDLSQAKFKQANLCGIQIKNCKALAVDFEYAQFANQVSSKVSIAQADITESVLRFSRFVRVNLAGCDLSSNDFSEADFAYSNLSEANLTHCLLDNASFTHGSLESAELQESSIINLDLKGCTLKNLKLSPDQCIEFLRLFEIEVV